MSIRKSVQCFALVLLVGFLLPPVSEASVHNMVIQEIFVGPPAEAANPGLAPDQRAQYVMLEMASSGQRFTANRFFRVEDADGNVLGRFGTFTATQSNGGSACSYPNCPSIMLGTQAAKNLFSFSFDKIVDGESGRVALPVEGGRVCFVSSSGTTVYDCVAWGSFDCTRTGNCTGVNNIRTGDVAGNACDSDYGTPAATGTGLLYGTALIRTSFTCGAKDNSFDFATLFPHPVNNAGANDNSDGDLDGLIDVLDCNDLDPSAFWAPVEVSGVTVTGGMSATLMWNSQGAASGASVNYDVIRGTVEALSTFGDSACFSGNNSAAMVVDPTDPGSVGSSGFYYVIRAENGTCSGGFDPARSTLDSVCP